MKEYSWRETREIRELLKRLERAAGAIEAWPMADKLVDRWQRKSMLKSSLYSARIEGNPLKLSQVKMMTGKERSKEVQQLEVENLVRAMRYLRSSRCPKRMSLKLVKKLHELVLANLSAEAGKLRRQPSAIFNQAGVAIRVNPSPQKVPELIRDWLAWVKGMKEEPVAVKSALVHFGLEKIHPFLDGNGRVGRLVSQFVLQRGGYEMKGLVSFEEYLEKNRQEYYDLLASERKEVTEFVEFFLQALVESAEKVVRKLKRKPRKVREELLLPRRKEILEIIRDHKVVSFDFVKRRFLEVKPSTLHYDLQQLVKAGLVRKLGATRGVRYGVRG